MDLSIPLYKHNDQMITKASSLYSTRSISVLLNIILAFVVFIFILSLLNSTRQETEIISIETTSILPIDITVASEIIIPRKSSYFDYEPFLKNISVSKMNRTRQFYYVDVGCFDGRDIDYFVHFHSREISHLGALNIIAFEPDPINFPSCKPKRDSSKTLNNTVYESAAWTQNGKVRYAIERGQKSKMDENSALYVRSIDFSQWILETFLADDFVYVKFTVEGAEVPILEKMIDDRSLMLVDYLDIEWNADISPDFEPRRVSLECMFDNFGMDFLYMINPADMKHAFYANETFSSVPKDKGWTIRSSLARFHYKTRKEVPVLLAERLKRKEQLQSF